MRIGVITFPGSIDERETAAAIAAAGAEPIELWHNEANLARVDAVVLPGGAAHGNYLRPGALAALAPIMTRVISAADSGLPVLGISNGFQILCEARLLPGAFVANTGARFRSAPERLIFANTQTAFTSLFEAGDEIVLPVRTGAGTLVADAETIAQIESAGHVVARFEDDSLGSTNQIAAVRNEAGNVLGIMASPEQSIEVGFTPEDPATRLPTAPDGLKFFESLVSALAA